jgi:hypothetical protein
MSTSSTCLVLARFPPVRVCITSTKTFLFNFARCLESAAGLSTTKIFPCLISRFWCWIFSWPHKICFATEALCFLLVGSKAVKFSLLTIRLPVFSLFELVICAKVFCRAGSTWSSACSSAPGVARVCSQGFPFPAPLTGTCSQVFIITSEWCLFSACDFLVSISWAASLKAWVLVVLVILLWWILEHARKFVRWNAWGRKCCREGLCFGFWICLHLVVAFQ